MTLGTDDERLQALQATDQPCQLGPGTRATCPQTPLVPPWTPLVSAWKNRVPEGKMVWGKIYVGSLGPNN